MTWLQRLIAQFKKKQGAPKPLEKPKPVSKPAPKRKPAPKKKTKLAFIVGHNEKSQGADGIGIPPEYTYYLGVANLLIEKAENTPVEVGLFFREADSSYSREVKDAYAATDKWGADLTVEGHYNSSGSSVRGCETLHSKSEASTLFAGVMQKHMIKATGVTAGTRRDRGLKYRIKKHGMKNNRGWLSVYSGKAPACVIEPAFGSNKLDAKILKENQGKIAQAILDATREYAGV